MDTTIAQKLTVVWQKNTQNNEWFDFLRLDLTSSYFTSTRSGVFVIWYISPSGSKVIKVGSGTLLEQFRNLLVNPLILQYSKSGPLKISWVAVNGALKTEHMPGVEAYLYNVYSPLVGEKPQVPPIEVNLIGK